MTEADVTDYAALADEISGWLREQMAAAGADRFVLGLSGGIDSAVVCALCTMAAGPSRVIAAIMPIHSLEADRRDAELAASSVEVVPHLIDLGPAYDALIAALPAEGTPGLEDATTAAESATRRRQLALANMKPRLRMTTLYALANRYNGIVAGTGNKTELSVGYFTKYGDGGVDLLPIGDLSKTDVRALARELSVPRPIVERAPSAGLWEGQTDESEMGVTYPELDAALAAILAGDTSGVDRGVRQRAEALIAASEHKRRPAPMYRQDAPTGRV